MPAVCADGVHLRGSYVVFVRDGGGLRAYGRGPFRRHGSVYLLVVGLGRTSVASFKAARLGKLSRSEMGASVFCEIIYGSGSLG